MSIIIEYQLVEPIIRLKNVPNFKRILNTLPERAEALSPGQWTQAARPERAEALSPGHRPGCSSNQQGAL